MASKINYYHAMAVAARLHGAGPVSYKPLHLFISFSEIVENNVSTLLWPLIFY